jgi:hypothetical protein
MNALRPIVKKEAVKSFSSLVPARMAVPAQLETSVMEEAAQREAISTAMTSIPVLSILVFRKLGAPMKPSMVSNALLTIPVGLRDSVLGLLVWWKDSKGHVVPRTRSVIQREHAS